MGSVSVSQAINGRGVAATISWDNDFLVTVKITGNAGYGAQAYWRIRGANPDTTVYISDTDASSGTFQATEGTTYYFQAVWGSRSDGASFTVTSDSGSGGSGGDSADYSRGALSITQGSYTGIFIKRTSSPLCGYSTGGLYNMDSAGENLNGDGWTDGVIAKVGLNDKLKISFRANPGYELDTSKTGDNYGLKGATYTGLTYHETDDEGWRVYAVTSYDPTITSYDAIPKEYSLSISNSANSIVTVTRISTKHPSGTIEVLTDGSAIYYGDELQIIFSASTGCKIDTHTINGSSFESGDTFTVDADANVVIEATTQGLVYIDNGTEFEAYQCFIDNGTKWEQYIPYIDNGTSWDLTS